MAEKNLDHSYTVRTLLMIWWSCIDNGNIIDVSTPRQVLFDNSIRTLPYTTQRSFLNTMEPIFQKNKYLEIAGALIF